MLDLYAVDLSGLKTQTLCGGNTGDKADEDNESCATLTYIPGLDGGVEIGDTKNPAAKVRFTGPEMKRLVTAYAEQNGLTIQ